MGNIWITTDDGEPEDVGDVDPHFYEKQVPPSSPFGGEAKRVFALAKARGLDKARVKLIKRIMEEDEKMSSKGFGLGLAGFNNGKLIRISRSIDGFQITSDRELADKIKL